MNDEIRFTIDPDHNITIDLDSAPEAEAIVEAVNPAALEAFRHAKHAPRVLFGRANLCG